MPGILGLGPLKQPEVTYGPMARVPCARDSETMPETGRMANDSVSSRCERVADDCTPTEEYDPQAEI